jgi:hypothetical protein
MTIARRTILTGGGAWVLALGATSGAAAPPRPAVTVYKDPG